MNESIEFKQLVVDFGSDLSNVADDLYEATTEKLPADRKASIIGAGERKLQEYQALLGKVRGVHRAEVEKDYGETVGEIREYLRILASNIL